MTEPHVGPHSKSSDPHNQKTSQKYGTQRVRDCVPHQQPPTWGLYQKAPKMFGFENQWGLRPGESQNAGNTEIPFLKAHVQNPLTLISSAKATD